MTSPSPFKKILIGTDFSEAASLATHAAARLVRQEGGTLVLAHAYESPLFTGDALSGPVENAARERLRAEADNLRQAGTNVEEVFVFGSAQDQLRDIAREHAPGTLVLASQKKRRAAQRWFVDGIIERVSQTAESPTLVLRHPSVFEDWLAGARPLKVFIAVDLASQTFTTLEWVKDLARLAPTEITVAYANWVPSDALRLGYQDRESFFSVTAEMQQVLERDLREKVARVFGDASVTILVEPRWGRADAPLIDLARAAEADLLVVGTRQRAGLSRWFQESVSLGALHHAPMNVAVVPLREPDPAAVEPPAYTRVLVGTDFSPQANHAIPHAYAITAPGGTVGLVHIVGRLEEDFAEARRQLHGLIPAAAAERGIATEILVTDNRSAAEGLAQAAGRFGAHAVVIGSHGRTGVLTSLLGSVAQAVLAASDLPVLIVKHRI